MSQIETMRGSNKGYLAEIVVVTYNYTKRQINRPKIRVLLVRFLVMEHSFGHPNCIFEMFHKIGSLNNIAELFGPSFSKLIRTTLVWQYFLENHFWCQCSRMGLIGSEFAVCFLLEFLGANFGLSFGSDLIQTYSFFMK